QGSSEAARRFDADGGGFECRTAWFQGSDFVAFYRYDLVENGGHDYCTIDWVRSASACMHWPAAPDASVSRAFCTPAVMSSAWPDTYSAAPALNATMSPAMPGSPDNTLRTRARLCSALSTRRASSEPRCRPTSSGAIL